MEATNNRHGAVVVVDIREGRLLTRTYYGYTKREALRKFREEFGKTPRKKGNR